MKDMDMERYGKKYCPFLVKGPILIRFGCLARNFNPETYLPEMFCVPKNIIWGLLLAHRRLSTLQNTTLSLCVTGKSFIFTFDDNPSAIDSDSIEPLSVLHSKLKFEW